MKHNNDPIKQANRKALPKFLLILLASCVVGGVIGFCAAAFGLEKMAGGLAAAGEFFSVHIAPWLLAACVVVLPAVCLPIYFSAKRQLAAWDGEDEALSDQVEGKLSVALWINSILLIVALFLVAASYAGGLISMEGSGVGFLTAIAAFILVMAEVIIMQQKMVDLCKRIYPEKQGSVYDTKFQKKWLDSCDEAEKIIIGKCAYKAYSAVNMTCMALWLVFTLTALFLGTGFLPVLTVCIVWGVSQSVYCWQSIKLSRPGAVVL